MAACLPVRLVFLRLRAASCLPPSLLHVLACFLLLAPPVVGWGGKRRGGGAATAQLPLLPSCMDITWMAEGGGGMRDFKGGKGAWTDGGGWGLCMKGGGVGSGER